MSSAVVFISKCAWINVWSVAYSQNILVRICKEFQPLYDIYINNNVRQQKLPDLWGWVNPLYGVKAYEGSLFKVIRICVTFVLVSFHSMYRFRFSWAIFTCHLSLPVRETFFFFVFLFLFLFFSNKRLFNRVFALFTRFMTMSFVYHYPGINFGCSTIMYPRLPQLAMCARDRSPESVRL